MHGRTRILAAAGAAALASLGAAQPAHANTTLTGNTTTDNAFFVFVSTNPAILGTMIASGNNWSTSFPVTPTNLGPGSYFLQVEAINYGGPGGFSGIFNLSGNGLFSNGTHTLTTDPSNLAFWMGGYNSPNGSVAVQPWIPPAGGVFQSTYPWGNVVGTPYWIWPSDPLSSPGGPGGPCDTCTVDMMAQFVVPSIGGVPEPASWAMMLLGFAGMGSILRKRDRSKREHTIFA